MAPSDRLAFDIITGSEKILATIKVVAPATITDKTSRKTITMNAPRLAHKRVIHTSELNAMRAYGSQIGLEQMKDRIAREQMDMKNMVDRTLEHWACGALRGIIYDADLTTELVNYGLATQPHADLDVHGPLDRCRQRAVNQDPGISEADRRRFRHNHHRLAGLCRFRCHGRPADSRFHHGTP